MDISITLEYNEWQTILQIYDEAIEFIHLPENWRIAEYALTKAHATKSVERIKTQMILNTETKKTITLPYFDWSLLQGEIARLYIYKQNLEFDCKTIYELIDGEFKKNESVNKLLKIFETEKEITSEMDKFREIIRNAVRNINELKEKQENLEKLKYGML